MQVMVKKETCQEKNNIVLKFFMFIKNQFIHTGVNSVSSHLYNWVISLKTTELFSVATSITEVDSSCLFKMQPVSICFVGSTAED